MRILLTGATGFIGSRVARLALAQGHEVAALARPGSGLRRIESERSRIRVVEGDLGNAAVLQKTLSVSAPDVCIHLAWYAEPGKYLWARENLDCLTGSFALLRALHDAGCRRVVLAGTSAEYEVSDAPVSEESPIRPRTLYAAAKHSLALIAESFDFRGGSVASARIFSLYGPDENPNRLVPYVVTRLLAGEECELTAGDAVRDYSHVDDVAGALLAIASSSVTGPVNVGSALPLSVRSLALRLADLVGRPELLRLGARPTPPGETRYLVADTLRLRREVGYAPRYDLDSGLAETVSWWRSRT